jgi:hypothetical protein
MNSQNIDGNTLSTCSNFLGTKRERITHTPIPLTKNTNKNTKTASNLNCKFKLKQNSRIRKLKSTTRPKAPHNTTQYLSSLRDYSSNNHSELDITNYETDIEDICVTGGTMKGIISLINNIDYGFMDSDASTNESTEESLANDLTYYDEAAD